MGQSFYQSRPRFFFTPDGGLQLDHPLLEPIIYIMPNIAAGAIALFVALTVYVVSGKKPTITIPLSLRGKKLIGSVVIGNQGFDMAFAMSSDDVWVLGGQLRDHQQLQKSQSFSHHFYTRSSSLKNSDGESYFESAEFNHNTRTEAFKITGKSLFEEFSFHNDDGKKDTSFKNPTAVGIVDTFDTPLKSVSLHYDGMFGLWPWKDDSPECPMLEWDNDVLQYTDRCLSLFGKKKKVSYFKNLPKMKYSLHLSGTGDSGELILGGYDASKIDGPVACEPIYRISLDFKSELDRYHTVVVLETQLLHGETLLTAGKKRRRKPIRQAIIDIEVRGLQLPRPTLQEIMKQAGVTKKTTVMPSISEEQEQHNAAHEKDRGYFIPCSRRKYVTDIGFFMTRKKTGLFSRKKKKIRVSITGDDMFIPSKVNPSWCKMVIGLLPANLAEMPIIVLGDTFFKKYVTIFDFKGGRGKTSMCVGTPKKKDNTARITLLSPSNSTTRYYDNYSSDGATELLNISTSW